MRLLIFPSLDELELLPCHLNNDEDEDDDDDDGGGGCGVQGKCRLTAFCRVGKFLVTPNRGVENLCHLNMEKSLKPCWGKKKCS